MLNRNLEQANRGAACTFLHKASATISAGLEQTHEITALNLRFGAPACAQHESGGCAFDPAFCTDQRSHQSGLTHSHACGPFDQAARLSHGIKRGCCTKPPHQMIFTPSTANDLCIKSQKITSQPGGLAAAITPRRTSRRHQRGFITCRKAKSGRGKRPTKPTIMKRVGAHQPPCPVSHSNSCIIIISGLTNQRPIKFNLHPAALRIKLARGYNQCTERQNSGHKPCRKNRITRQPE